MTRVDDLVLFAFEVTRNGHFEGFVHAKDRAEAKRRLARVVRGRGDSLKDYVIGGRFLKCCNQRKVRGGFDG